MQLLNNAIRLLLGSGLYQRDFEEWDRKNATDKEWMNLKPFIQEAYQQQLNVTGNTSGPHGYMQNAFATLEELDDDKDADVATVITQMAALTTQSQATVASTAATSSSVAAAIIQLNNNQQAMMQQMMAYANADTTHNPPAVQNPPPHAFQHSNHRKLPTRWERMWRQKAGAWAWRTRPCNRPRWTPHTTHLICRLHSAPRGYGREHGASLCTGSTGRHHGCT